jgi:hypothetical protein
LVGVDYGECGVRIAECEVEGNDDEVLE